MSAARKLKIISGGKDSIGRDNTKSRAPKGIKTETVAELWNKRHAIPYIMDRLKVTEVTVRRHLNAAAAKGLLSRKQKVHINQALADLILGRVRALMSDDIRIDVSHPQLCLLKRLTLSGGRMYLIDMADSCWNTRNALVHRGLAVTAGSGASAVMIQTDRGKIVSHQNIPFEVIMAECK